MIIVYKNAQIRLNDFKVYYDCLNEDEYDTSDMNTVIKSYSTVTEASHDFVTSQINLWLLATMSNHVWENSAEYKLLKSSTAEDKETHYDQGVVWHECILLICNHKVYCYEFFLNDLDKF